MILLSHLHGVCLIEIGEEETGESPVERRIIKTDAQPSLADSIPVLGDEVAVGRRLHRRKVAARIVKQCESIMVARSEHGVLHAGRCGNRGPGVRVELVWMK